MLSGPLETPERIKKEHPEVCSLTGSQGHKPEAGSAGTAVLKGGGRLLQGRLNARRGPRCVHMCSWAFQVGLGELKRTHA